MSHARGSMSVFILKTYAGLLARWFLPFALANAVLSTAFGPAAQVLPGLLRSLLHCLTLAGLVARVGSHSPVTRAFKAHGWQHVTPMSRLARKSCHQTPADLPLHCVSFWEFCLWHILRFHCLLNSSTDVLSRLLACAVLRGVGVFDVGAASAVVVATYSLVELHCLHPAHGCLSQAELSWRQSFVPLVSLWRFLSGGVCGCVNEGVSW